MGVVAGLLAASITVAACLALDRLGSSLVTTKGARPHPRLYALALGLVAGLLFAIVVG
ncbi:hypothetical protein OCUBac02_52950 (plasmid) [Bosea sp. ANAM02]|nr:hypothetical protein OCUBac02_52950 [Bosea sp. ANAM02]